MRLLTLSAGVGLIAGGVACSAIVGFQDFERVEPTGAPSAADGGGGGSGSGSGDDDGSTPPVDVDADAGTPLDSGADASASKICPAPAATAYPAWVSPPARPLLCNPSDLQTFLNNETTRTFDEQRAAMAVNNPACAACVFTLQSDAVWGPIVHTDDDRIFTDFGLCYRVAGTTDDCGAKAQDLEWCLQKICNVCLAGGQTLNDCRTAGKAGPCKPRLDATVSACTGFDQILNTTCGGSGNVVAELCGGA